MGVFTFPPLTVYFEPNFAGEPYVMIQGIGSRTWFAKQGKSVKSAKVPKGNLLRLWLEQENPNHHLLAEGEYPTLPDLNYSKDGCVETEIDGAVATTFCFFFRESSEKYQLTIKLHDIGELNLNGWGSRDIHFLIKPEPITCGFYLRDSHSGEYVATGSFQLRYADPYAELSDFTLAKESKVGISLTREQGNWEISGGATTTWNVEVTPRR